MSRTRHKLPDNLNPEGDICYPLFIPDDVEWKRYIVRAIRTLTFDRHWERDDNQGQDAIAVRRRWDESTLQPFVNALFNQTPCGDGESTLGACFRMDTATEAFYFYPNDPFVSDGTDDNVTVFGMVWKRWENTDIENSEIFQTVEDIVSSLVGYYPNDCLIFPSNLLQFVLGSWADVIGYFTLQTFPFPYVHVELEGTGQFEIELVNIPFGGSALIMPDTDITSWQGILDTIIEFIDLDGELPESWIFTEVDRDISIPPETAPTQTQEIEFDEGGEHSVTIVFIPRIDDEIPFLFPFGGIREIEVCGNLKIIGSQTGTEITKENAGLNEIKRKGVIGIMTAQEVCEGVICAFEEIASRILFAQDKDNILSSISIDKDNGTITLQQAQISRDDIVGTDQEKHYGGVYNQAQQLSQLFADINDYMDIPYANATINKLTKSFVGIDAIDEPTLSSDWDTAIGAYITADPDLVIDVDALALRFFCESISSGATSYAVDDELYSESLLNLFTDILVLIPKTTYSQWYKDGSITPLDGYQSAPCYRFPDAVMTYDTNDLDDDEKPYTVQPNIPAGSVTNDRRRSYRLQVIGQLVGDNYSFDGMYLTSLPGGVPQYEPVRLRHIEGGVNVGGVYSPITAPAFKPTLGYQVTTIVGFTTPNALRLWGIRIPDEIQTDTNVSGALQITCIDLGHPDA